MRWEVSTERGTVPVLADDEVGPIAVILAPGAGSHMEHRTMEWLSGIVREAGASVARFNFLYRVQGRSMPDRMPVLIDTYRAVIDSVRKQLGPTTLVIGGHSMGGRVASMLEAEHSISEGLLLFGYPLHPAGEPSKLRDSHLGSIRIPTLQFNGTEDALCTREIMERVVPRTDRWTLHWIEGADHSYGVKRSSGRTKQQVADEMRGVLSGWLGNL